jgi:hypothetical protein
MCKDPACDIRHVRLSSHIEVRDPDDEIVSHRSLVHIERMDDDTVWVGITAPDGERVDVDFWAVKGKLRMNVR